MCPFAHRWDACLLYWQRQHECCLRWIGVQAGSVLFASGWPTPGSLAFLGTLRDAYSNAGMPRYPSDRSWPTANANQRFLHCSMVLFAATIWCMSSSRSQAPKLSSSYYSATQSPNRGIRDGYESLFSIILQFVLVRNIQLIPASPACFCYGRRTR